MRNKWQTAIYTLHCRHSVNHTQKPLMSPSLPSWGCRYTDPVSPSLSQGQRPRPPAFTVKELCLADSSLKPRVECSVVTEFTDHICVTMDAELIMFLHDLVSAYLKEKEKGTWGHPVCGVVVFLSSFRKGRCLSFIWAFMG